MSDARDQLREFIGNAPCDHPSSSLAACSYCTTDALLAAPGVVIAALCATGALRRITTHAWDPTGCGIHKCNGNRRCHTLLRVVGGDGNDE